MAVPADPYNDFEPVDSSAAAIAAQGLIRLGNYHKKHGDSEAGNSYYQAGLTVAKTLFAEPYLSTADTHQGLLLHSVYHRPNGWDYVPEGRKIPCGEASMWGDYHAPRTCGIVVARDRWKAVFDVFLTCVVCERVYKKKTVFLTLQQYCRVYLSH